MALALGCTVRELSDRIGADELVEWTEYFNLEPWGEEMADLRSAQVCTVMANAWKGKKGRAYKIKDFLLQRPGDKPAKRQQTVDEMIAAMRGVARRMERREKKGSAGSS